MLDLNCRSINCEDLLQHKYRWESLSHNSFLTQEVRIGDLLTSKCSLPSAAWVKRDCPNADLYSLFFYSVCVCVRQDIGMTKDSIMPSFLPFKNDSHV